MRSASFMRSRWHYSRAPRLPHIGCPHRSTQRKVLHGRADEDRLTVEIFELANLYGSYGYPILRGLINNAGWHVNHKYVERTSRCEGLEFPQQQRKNFCYNFLGTLLRNALSGNGRSIRATHTTTSKSWLAYDFDQDCTPDGNVYRSLNSINEYKIKALMIRQDCTLKSTGVLDALSNLFILQGRPYYSSSYKG